MNSIEFDFKGLLDAVSEMGGTVVTVNKVVATEMPASNLGNEAKLRGVRVSLDIFMPTLDPDLETYNKEMTSFGVYEDGFIFNDLLSKLDKVKNPATVPESPANDVPVPTVPEPVPKPAKKPKGKKKKVTWAEKPPCFGTGACIEGLDPDSCDVRKDCEAHFPTDKDVVTEMEEAWGDEDGKQMTLGEKEII